MTEDYYEDDRKIVSLLQGGQLWGTENCNIDTALSP